MSSQARLAVYAQIIPEGQRKWCQAIAIRSLVYQLLVHQQYQGKQNQGPKDPPNGAEIANGGENRGSFREIGTPCGTPAGFRYL
jgi:hypothetical protein